MNIIPYMNFTGNCEEALNRYKEILKGEITYIQRYKDGPNMQVDDDYMDKILHARLKIGDLQIYFSDSFPGTPESESKRISLNLEFDNPDEIKRVFEALSRNGKIEMPLAEQFWGAIFGSLTDEFGISWSLNHEIKK